MPKTTAKTTALFTCGERPTYQVGLDAVEAAAREGRLLELHSELVGGDQEVPGWRLLEVGRYQGWTGTLVLPRSKRTEKIWKEGQLKRALRAGAEMALAKAISEACPGLRDADLAAVVTVAQDGETVGHWMAHPMAYGPGSGRSEWRAANAKELRRLGLEALTAPKELSVAKALQALAWADAI